jgi:hypothetical protein
MENWQMNEIFQDIPSLDASDNTVVSPLTKEAEDDLDMFVKYAFPEEMAAQEWDPPAVAPCAAETDPLPDGVISAVELDLKSVIDEAFGGGGLQGYQLLEELEALEREQSPPALAEDVAMTTESDHTYTQLGQLQIKPNETKKQAIRRVKNNAASKVCRKQRKNRFSNNVQKIEELTRLNGELRARLDSMQRVVSILQDHLVTATKCKV